MIIFLTFLKLDEYLSSKMKFLAVIFLTNVIAITYAATAEEQWSAFKVNLKSRGYFLKLMNFYKKYKIQVKFNRNYGAEEDAKRFEIFEGNLLKIEAHNKDFEAGKFTWRLSINQFADWTDGEILKLNHG